MGEGERFMSVSVSVDLVDIQKIRRCKHLRLHYNPIKQRFKLTAPWHISKRQCMIFVEENKVWMQEQVYGYKSLLFQQGEVLIWGNKFQTIIKKDIRTKVIIENERVTICCRDSARAQDYLKDYIKEQASVLLTMWCIDLCQKIGKPCPKITLRDTKSRWGSCSVRGINFSWRLAMLPKSIAFYVCAHEVAHLIHPNHSKIFWQLVSELCEDYQVLREDLRVLGRSVMRYNFK